MVAPAHYSFLLVIDRDVKVKDYFAFTDSLVQVYAPFLQDELTEYSLIHNNSWIIDSLAGIDYYSRKKLGQLVHDQKEIVVLNHGDLLLIPTPEQIDSTDNMLQKVVIDVNIPEYQLRIMVDSMVMYNFPVRVGRNAVKYLKMANREVDLRTPIGTGKIVRIIRNPDYINPVDNHQYYATRRDDDNITELPLIPWLEPEINGIRYGSLIHPTTNEATLGKAYSNGCVGTPEGAAWIIYYYAPLNTAVNFRYQLQTVNEAGDTLYWKDIYCLQDSVCN